jgi:hypothetical protein
MLRLLKVALLALAPVLGGCPLVYSEAPLGSEPVALDPKEINGVWALYARKGDLYEPLESHLFFVVAKDGQPGAAEFVMLRLADREPRVYIARFDATILRHNGAAFANFRVRSPNSDPLTMREGVFAAAVERISGSEWRVGWFSESGVGDAIKRGALPFKELSFGFRERSEWALGRLTPEQLDWLTTPEVLAKLFPFVGKDKEQAVFRKIPWPPPVGKE